MNVGNSVKLYDLIWSHRKWLRHCTIPNMELPLWSGMVWISQARTRRHRGIYSWCTVAFPIWKLIRTKLTVFNASMQGEQRAIKFDWNGQNGLNVLKVENFVIFKIVWFKNFYYHWKARESVSKWYIFQENLIISRISLNSGDLLEQRNMVKSVIFQWNGLNGSLFGLKNLSFSTKSWFHWNLLNSTGNLIFFNILVILSENCNFSMNITERDRILLENIPIYWKQVKFDHFP